MYIYIYVCTYITLYRDWDFSQIHWAKANAPARDGGAGPWLLWHRLARQGRAHGALLRGD